MSNQVEQLSRFDQIAIEMAKSIMANSTKPMSTYDIGEAACKQASALIKAIEKSQA